MVDLTHSIMFKQVSYFDGKGRGVVATQPIEKGSFVCEYAGDLISIEEAKAREAQYKEDPSIGSYLYFFKYRNQRLWYVIPTLP